MATPLAPSRPSHKAQPDPLDDPNFNPTEFINHLFPTGISLPFF